MAAEPEPIFVVSNPAEGPVTRYGTKTLIGCRRDLKNPRKLHFDTDEVVALPYAEYRKYLKEYNRAINSGALKKVDRAAYVAAGKKAAQKQKAAEKAAKKAAEAAEAEESSDRGTAPTDAGANAS